MRQPEPEHPELDLKLPPPRGRKLRLHPPIKDHNKEHVRRASLAINANRAYYCARYHQPAVASDGDLPELLSNMMHLALAKKIDFEDQLRRAKNHYMAEITDHPELYGVGLEL